MSRTPYVREIRDSVLRMNADTFKHHVVKSEGEGRWLYARPETGMFHFRVIAAPRAVIVYGDIDDVIFVPSDRNALGWLRSVVRGERGVYDVAYLAEKVRGRESITEFQPRLLEEWVAESRRQIEEERRDLLADDDDDNNNNDDEALEAFKDQLQALDDINLDPGSADLAYAEISNLGWVDEYPDLRGLTHTFLLQLLGLQHFCAAIDTQEGGTQ